MNFKSTLTRTLLLALILAFTGSISAQVFWSEDFADGIPTDWTNEDPSMYDALWTYCIAGGGGCSPAFGQGAFASTTALNGYITVNSDAIGAEQPAPPHISILTTTAIDCSAADVVFASFEGQIGLYELGATGNALLLVSTNGTDWDEYNVYEGLDATNSWSSNPQLSVLDITATAANQATVYLRIQWTANWEYFWNIDDLALSTNNPTPPNDIRVNDNFYAGALNARTPISQLETFGFLADIENIGSADQPNVNLVVNIENDANPGTSVFTETLGYGIVPAATLIENIPFDGDGFTPPAAIASYTGTYTISSDSMDSNPVNNTLTFDFEVTENVFAKERGVTSTFASAEGNWQDGENWSWAYGNYYHVVNGTGWWATHAVFGIGNATTDGVAGKTVYVRLYEWEDDGDGVAQPGERGQPLGFASYLIQGNEQTSEDGLITIPFTDNVSLLNGVPLKDDTDYLLMLEYPSDDMETNVAFLGSNQYDYGAQSLRSEAIGIPRYGAFLSVGHPLDLQDYNPGGFAGGANVPVARLIISDQDPNPSNVVTLSDDNKVNVFPSPAQNYIDVALELTEMQEEVTLRVLNVTGKVIGTRTLNDVQESTNRFDVSELPVGSYFLNVSTAKGNRSVPFVIAR